MPKFEVEIIRYAHGFYTTVVEAGSREEAEDLALEEAYDEVIPTQSADYEVWGSTEIKE